MKKKIIALLLSAICAVPAFASAPGFGQCAGYAFPNTYCDDGYVCTYVNAYYSQCLPGNPANAGGQFTLQSPPGNVSYMYSGGQAIGLTAYNLNVLGALVTVTCNYGSSWNFVALPFTKMSNSYSILHILPVGWYFQASTNADAAAISFTVK